MSGASRRVIITKSSYLINFVELSKHALVNKCWALPHEYTLIELNHPKLQRGSSDNAASSAEAVVSLEEAALFVPFYGNRRSLADIAAFHLLADTASYHLITTNRTVLRWPRFHCVGNWTNCKTIQLVCRLSTKSEGAFHVLRDLLLEWATSMKKYRQLRRLEPLPAPGAREYSVTCDFVGGSGDSLMALFMLLADTSGESSVTSVGLEPPEQLSASNQNLDQRVDQLQETD